jgi:PAS domain S-box-containing protein
MIWRMQVADGLYIDARSVPIAVITLFEGWLAGGIAMLFPVVYRISRGGGGAPAGVVLVVSVWIVAGLVRRWMLRDGRIGVRHGATLGAAVFLVTLASYALAGRRGLQLLDDVAIPYAVTYAVAIGVITRLFHDVTQRARLAAERDRFRAIIDAASDAIRIVDPDTLRIIDCNRADADISGYARSDMIGRDVRDFWPTDPALKLERQAELSDVRNRGVAERFGVPYRTASGATIKVDATHRMVEHGRRRYEIVVFRNAGDREAAEAARREASELRAVNLLANAAAHEINNPLAVVIGSLDLLTLQVATHARETELASQARKGAERIRDIVARMRNITRLEADPPHGMVPPMLDIRKSADKNGPEIG